MIDAASQPPAPGPVAADWREGLRSWAHDLWTLYQERPWIPRVPIYRAPSGPNQIAWLERGLAQLASTELTAKEKLSALTLLSGFVRQAALLQTELEEGREAGQAKSESERAYGAALSQVISAQQHPHLTEVLAAEAFGDGPTQEDKSDRDFTEGLELILDGLSAQISATGH